MYDIIIIGAGPAGLAAALYAIRSMKKVLVLEEVNYGGQIINTQEIDNYPVTPHISGYDFATTLYNQVKDFNCEIKFDGVIEIQNLKDKKIVKTKNSTYKTKTIIIASGTDIRKLNLLNEEKLTGYGVSYCATCDGAFFKGKDVCVVGGGNTAIGDAIYLSELANHVYLVHRRDTLRASEILINTLHEKNNVEFIYNSNVTKIEGNNKLESIEVTNNNGYTKKINVAGLFVAIGRIPKSSIFKNLVELDELGYIKSDENCHTSVPGIFVAGDVRVKNLRQLVTATSDGAIAASEAIKYINSKELESKL